MSPADDAFWPAGCLCTVIEAGGLHVLHASRTMGRIRVRGQRFYALEEGSAPSPQAVASDLERARTELKAAGADVVLVVPGAWAITRRAELPPTVGGHLANVVGYEMDRLTPLSSDEAWYDYGLIEQRPDAVRLAVSAVRADRIDPYLEALRERGIEVRKVVPEMDALGSLCRFVCRIDTCVLLKPSADRYEVGLLEKGVLSQALSGNFTSTDPRERALRLARDVRELLERALPEEDPPWVMAGPQDVEAAKGLAEKMDRPVRVLQAGDIRKRIGEAPDGLSMTALGGILSTIVPEAGGVNLLDRGARAGKRPPRAATACLAAALAAVGLFLLASPVALEERRIGEIDRQIEQHRDEVRKADAVKREAEGLEADIASIYRFKGERPVVLELLRELTTVMPKGSWLSRARIADNGADLEGYAAAATDILPLLEASPHFKKAEFSSPTLRDARLNAERFTIRMELEGLKGHGLEPAKKQ